MIETQDYFRTEYKKINKNWNDSVSIYKKFLSNEITTNTIVLEAGCGFSNLYAEEYNKAKKVIGIDIDTRYLTMNSLISEKIISDLSHFPEIEDNSIDIIISSWVLEHLEYPEKVFKEFSRVLKKGGKFIFLTPNSWSYVVIFNKIMPKWLRNLVAKKLSGGTLLVDPMKTFYRANSILKIKRLIQNTNLQIKQITLNGDPTYIAINRIFFYIGIVLEQFMNLPFLKYSKVHIIGVLQKK